MRMKRKLCMSIALAILILILSFCFLSFADVKIPPKPSENSYVFDYANIIDHADEEKMKAVASKIEEKSKAEIVVVTVESLGSYTIEEFANTLFNSWGIGDKKLNNGVLILVNKENLLSGRKGRIRIEVGYGLEGAITDGKAGRILDTYAIPAFENKEYSKGIKDTFLAVAGEVAKEYGLEIDGVLNEEDSSREEINITPLYFLILFMVFMFIFIFAIIFIAYKGETGRTITWTWENGKWHKTIYYHNHFWRQSNSFSNDKDKFDSSDDHSSFGGFGDFGGGSSGGGGASR